MNQSKWCGREIMVCGHEVKWRDMGGTNLASLRTNGSAAKLELGKRVRRGVRLHYLVSVPYLPTFTSVHPPSNLHPTNVPHLLHPNEARHRYQRIGIEMELCMRSAKTDGVPKTKDRAFEKRERLVLS